MAKWQQAPAVEQGRWSQAPAVSSAEPARPRQFVGPPVSEARIMTSPRELKDAAIGVGDVVTSSLRSMVNKPAASLMGVVGALNPNDTYMAARDRYRDAIATDQLLVRDDRVRTPQGAEVAQGLGRFAGVFGIPQATEVIGSTVERYLGPEARDFGGSVVNTALLGAPRALNALGRGRAPLNAPNAAPEPGIVDPVTRALTDASGRDSAGAAAAVIDPNSLSPQIRQVIEAGARRGEQLDAEALARVQRADSLPIPVPLTEGMVRQSPIQISLEQNLRGKHPEMALRIDEINKRLGQNLQAVRDAIGPEVFSANVVEHGDALIGAYKAADEAANAQIGALYQKLRDANGGAFPVDARQLFSRASAMLHKALLFDHAPPAIMTTLNRLAKSNAMTFENFEALRTNLARIQRSATTDGNTVAAAGIIRQAMEELPLAPQAATLKPLADEARAAARAHFQQLERDPAWRAAVRDSVPPDRFVQKFIISAPRDQLDVMMSNLGKTDSVRQTMAVAALDYLRDAARLDANYTGNFSAAGFNKALSALDPKAGILFDPRTAETLGNLRQTAVDATFQPRGSFVNNSNTAVAAAAKYAGNAAEGAANYAAHGIPVGSFARSMIEAAGTRRQISRALKPGAGVMRPRPPKGRG